MTTEHQLPLWANGRNHQLSGTAAEEFFSERIPKLYPRLLRFARATLHNFTDADDVVQESLLKAYQHIRGYRAQADLSTWVLRITWNECMNLRRKRRREVTGLDYLFPGQESRCRQLWVQGDDTPEQACRAREIDRAVRTALLQITPCYAAAWALREMAFLSHAEIATRMGINVSTVKVRIHRARIQLRRLPGIRLLGSMRGCKGREARPHSSHDLGSEPGSRVCPIGAAPRYTNCID